MSADPLTTNHRGRWRTTTIVVSAAAAVQILAALFYMEIWLELLSLFWFVPLVEAGVVVAWVAVVVWVSTERGAPALGRALRCAAMVAGAVIAWHAPTIGRYSLVWSHQWSYLAQIRAAAQRPEDEHWAMAWADRRVAPATVRGAVTFFAAHGDWIGVVHDPLGDVERDGNPEWLLGPAPIKASHLWGPWYWCWSLD